MKRDWLLSLLLAVVVLGVWEATVTLAHTPTYLLPAPSLIAWDAFSNLAPLSRHVGITLFEAAVGFLLANVAALLFAVLTIYIPRSDRAILPLAIALKTTPIVAMAPLLLLWFGTGMVPKFAAAALISFFPCLVNTMKGLHALQEGELDLFSVYCASKTDVLRKLRAQRASPYVISALKVSSSLAIVGAIVGEFVGANAGVGYVILTASYHLETVHMFSALAATSLAGVLFYGLIAYLDRKVLFWVPESLDEVRLESPPQRQVGVR